MNKTLAEKRRLEKARIAKLRTVWSNKFAKKLITIHKQFTKQTVVRLLKRIDRAIPAIQLRSKKVGVECKLTLNQLRTLIYNNYGSPCKFCGRPLVINNFVLDHIVPISRGGSSNLDNLQLICKSCNTRKGSLDEGDYYKLLEWLETMPEYFRKNVLARLAGGRG